MSTYKYKCVVPGCPNKSSSRHRIPTLPGVCGVWLERIGNPELLERPFEELRKFRVCSRHFADECKLPNNKLKKHALPTLNLPEMADPMPLSLFWIPPKPEEAVTPVRGRLPELPEPQPGPSWKTPETPSPQWHVVKHPGEHVKSYKGAGLAFRDPEEHKRILSESRMRLFASDIPEPAPHDLPEAEEDLEVSVPLQKDLLESSLHVPEEGMEIPTVTQGTPRLRRQGLLREVCLKTQSDLPPLARHFYRKALSYKKLADRKKRNTAKQVSWAKQVAKDKFYEKLLQSVNTTTYQFIMSQQRLQTYKPRGRRFSVDDKILALSLYRESGKGYRFLRNIFSLPSRKTLSKLLNKIPFLCGINKHIFLHLKETVSKMKHFDKYCCLIFDEMSLDVGLQYNKKLDVVEGFEDYGNGERKLAFADHALVFMLRGIHRKWKQPICFYFCESSAKTPHLMRILKEIIREVRATGLKLVATICDQGSTNVAAINGLMKETEEFCLRSGIENKYVGFLVDGEEIVALYDFPHLIKGIRNNLLQKDLHFTINGEAKVASWRHVVELYHLDKAEDNLLHQLCPRLTEQHVIPDKIKKMKVSFCTQVFSQRVSAVMRKLATLASASGTVPIDPKASETADLLLFFDQLFDSVNSSVKNPPFDKELRGAVTKNSAHNQFWNHAISVLKTMYFTNPESSHKLYPPSLKHWIFSLYGLRYLWNRLSGEGFKFLLSRNLNQDPIENFFGCIRSHGVRNINPTCSSFIISFKSLLVSNFLSRHSATFNCEEDDTTGALDTLKRFITENVDVSFTPPIVLPPPEFHSYYESPESSFLGAYSNAYVAGCVAKNLYVLAHSCHDCLAKMQSQVDLPEHAITACGYSHKSLVKPNTLFMSIFQTLAAVVVKYLPVFYIQFQFKSDLACKIRSEAIDLNLSALFCRQHISLVDKFLSIVLNILIFHDIKIINRILHGKDTRTYTNPIKCLAKQKAAKMRKH